MSRLSNQSVAKNDSIFHFRIPLCISARHIRWRRRRPVPDTARATPECHAGVETGRFVHNAGERGFNPRSGLRHQAGDHRGWTALPGDSATACSLTVRRRGRSEHMRGLQVPPDRHRRERGVRLPVPHSHPSSMDSHSPHHRTPSTRPYPAWRTYSARPKHLLRTGVRIVRSVRPGHVSAGLSRTWGCPRAFRLRRVG